MKIKSFFYIAFSILISFNSLAQNKERKFKIHTLAFYNLENLFDTINDVIEKHLKLNSDFFSVTILKERLYNLKGEPINHNKNELIQTQDLEPLYIENSGFYVFTKENFKKNNSRISSNSKFYETTYPENIDIDNEYDFQIAESALENF